VIVTDELDTRFDFEFAILTMMAMRRKEIASHVSLRLESSNGTLWPAVKVRWQLSRLSWQENIEGKFMWALIISWNDLYLENAISVKYLIWTISAFNMYSVSQDVYEVDLKWNRRPLKDEVRGAVRWIWGQDLLARALAGVIMCFDVSLGKEHTLYSHMYGR